MTPLARKLCEEAKRQNLWALGHPKEIGGGGMAFLDYAYVNEVIGRSHVAQLVLGTSSLQTSLMLQLHASPEWKQRVLKPLVGGEYQVAFAITEPDVAGSDPTAMQATGRLEEGEWVINGRKWFISLLALAEYVVVGVNTEGADAPAHKRASMIIVPKTAPGFKILRDLPVLARAGVLSGHYEIEFDNVRVPEANLIGRRGEGFTMAQDRLGPGRIYHCMRWLGQAQRAFDIMCKRANYRMLAGRPLADRELVQKMVFDSYSEIQAARLMVLDAAAKIDQGSQARIEISAIKVLVPNMAHNVIDRALQVHGAMGTGPDTPLELMYRSIRTGRFVDGADEVHITRTARRILSAYKRGEEWDFGLR
jgi:alkylation response protein AidB-like acyl-CoA dehydrogenase